MQHGLNLTDGKVHIMQGSEGTLDN